MITLSRIAPDGTMVEVGGIGLQCSPRDAHKHLSGVADGAYRISRPESPSAYARASGGVLRPCARKDVFEDEEEGDPPPIRSPFPATV